jgi:hypothetical protein
MRAPTADKNVRQMSAASGARASPYAKDASKQPRSVRQGAFRNADLENVRHITSAIVEAVPDKMDVDPIYSTGAFRPQQHVTARSLKNCSEQAFLFQVF